MFWIAACCALLSGVEYLAAASVPTTTVIVIVGEPGESKYEKMFVDWAGQWRDAAANAESRYIEIGTSVAKESDRADREILRETLSGLSGDPPETLWIVFLGHGTFDGKKARFNLRGADITATELAEQLSPLSCRTAIINCASASGSFVNRLSGTNRVVVSATQSGFEHNFARFGGYLSQSIGDISADLDKDGQTSLLEAWLAAAKQTSEYYDSESQLATEHSLLDDNGDGKGTPADWFRGIHLVKSSKDDALPDGTLANQFSLYRREGMPLLSGDLRQQRDQLELQLAQLRQQKSHLAEAEYLRRLEEILVQLAKIYRQSEQTQPAK